jgi:hypothetical protein
MILLRHIKNRIEKYAKREVKKMKINVTNNLPNVNVTVNQNDDGSLAILLFEKKGKKLGDFKPGETVKFGDREYIVLGHAQETTAVITKDIVKEMEFGKTGDYTKSYVREFCNGEFYKELAKAVGKDNIVPHRVNLMCDDGSNKGVTCKDNISILTTENYRRYREFLPAIGKWYWTATGVTTLDKDYARVVCYVNSRGVLCWDDCFYCYGVRPFCILNSSILVS